VIIITDGILVTKGAILKVIARWGDTLHRWGEFWRGGIDRTPYKFHTNRCRDDDSTANGVKLDKKLS